MLESTFHPPIFALAVVKRPVDPLIVVIPLVDAELNVRPKLFNMYPAPLKAPCWVRAPDYNDPPEAIETFPLNVPCLAVIFPSIINEDPSHDK